MTNQDTLQVENKKENTKKYKVLNVNFIETILFLGGIIYLLLLVANILLASFFGYNIFNNYISELGDNTILPFPFLNDGITIFCGLIMFFSHFYYVYQLKIQYNLPKYSIILLALAFLSGIIGALGYFFLGIFSLDRGGPSDLFHGISMGFAFSGFLTSIAIYSLLFIFIHNNRLKKIGLYGLIIPFFSLIVYIPTNNPLAEWILLFAIIGFFLTLIYYISQERERSNSSSKWR